MPAGKQAGDYSPIVQLSPISNINKVAVVGDIDITTDSTKATLDTILLIPAALIILNPMKGELTSIPWIFLAVLIMSIGDSAFAYSSNVTALQKMNWVWNLFFVTSYFVTSAGLFWHNRFFIYNNKEKSRSHYTERSRRY